ncbi:CU044_5270 family protein [Streptomyces sp. NPDC004647]|uniref:CU044_5270 family protein n=1 Tax=Streptomyces sp. NPDC004647 TaxID=3154671 RepID=UPI00339E84FC
MNRNDIPPSHPRHSDVDDLAGLLPAPAEWDLPHEQHLYHKELLMQHIDRDQATQSARPARRLLRPALLLPVTALGLGGILAVGVAFTGDDGRPSTAGSQPHGANDMRPAAALLDQISDVALKGDTPSVRDDQFTYTRAKIREADLTSGKAVVGPLKEHETWASQQQGPLHKPGLTRVDGETLPINAELGDTNGTPAGISRPTYRWLASLPTDSDEMLTYLYAKTPKVDGQERDQAVFERVGDLIGGVMPPRTAAALYQAAAKIPGVDEAPDAHDAIGRRGVGIARDDTTFGTRTEWVFDKDDLTFLGSRSYLIKDSQYGKHGTLMSSRAEIEHAVVDKAGEEPAAAQETRPGSQKS